MQKGKILVTDDDSAIRLAIKSYITKLGYEVDTAEDGEDAYKKIQADKVGYNLLLTDLDMPVMNGNNLIKLLKDIQTDLIIIVVSSHDESKVIIDIMRMGVFDYLIKPINKDEIGLKVTRAMEASWLRKEKGVYEKEKIIRLENQINWFNYKEQLKFGEAFKNDTVKKNLFHNLRTNLGQGIGFGLLTTLSDMLLMSPRNENKDFIVSQEMMDILRINADYAKKVLNYFADLEKLLEEGFPLFKINLVEIYQAIKTVQNKLTKKLESKRQKIIISEMTLPDNIFIKSNKDFFADVMQELFINAIKYSELESIISVLIKLEEKNLNITVMNIPYRYSSEKTEGIKEELQNLIFEPFFRIDKGVTEEEDSLNYGLGLTKVKIILQRMNASIQVSNIRDYSGEKPVIKVGFTISIPFT